MTESPTSTRILIIDDEEQIRRFLRISLKSQGYQAIEAETAARGLEFAATQTPDLVVLDLGLPDAGIYDDGYLRIDLVKRLVSVMGDEVHLTRKEFAILKLLVSNPGQVITQTQLLREIWGPTHAHDTHYLRNFIGRIRQKLREDTDEPRYLRTEPGVGYRFLDGRGH